MSGFSNIGLQQSVPSAPSSEHERGLDLALNVLNEGFNDAFCLYIAHRGESEVIDQGLQTMKQVDGLRGSTPRVTVCRGWLADFMPTWYAMPSMLRFAMGQATGSDRLAERRGCAALSQPDPHWQKAWDEAFDTLSDADYRKPMAAATYYMKHNEFSSAVVSFAEAIALHRQRALRASQPIAKHDDGQWAHMVQMYVECLCQLRSPNREAVVESLAARYALKLKKHQIAVPPSVWGNTPRLVAHLLAGYGEASWEQKLTALALWNACHTDFDGIAPSDMLTQFAQTQKTIVDTFDRALLMQEGEVTRPKVFDNIRLPNAPLVTQTPASADQPGLDLFDVPSQAQHFMKCVQRGNTCRRALLLYGQPGTGKTSLAEAMLHRLCSATDSNVFIYRLDPNEVLSSHFSESVANMTAIIHSLSQEKNKDGSPRKVVVKIDEVDRLQGKRKIGESQENKRITTCLFDAFDNSSSNFQNLYMIATTNLAEDIDDAMLRRYAFKAEVPLPNQKTYRKIMAHCAANWPAQAWAELDATTQNKWLEHCDGVSAGDLVHQLSAGGIQDSNDVHHILLNMTKKRLCRKLAELEMGHWKPILSLPWTMATEYWGKKESLGRHWEKNDAQYIASSLRIADDRRNAASYRRCELATTENFYRIVHAELKQILR